MGSQQRCVLFLSALDYKTRSIEVIKKTPEAYARRGWKVLSIVARDGSESGNYFYEPVVNPEGVTVERFSWPLTRVYDRTRVRLLKSLLLKLRHYSVVVKLAVRARRVFRYQIPDIVYGYEYHGVLASHLLAVLTAFTVRRSFLTVARYQGSFFYDYWKQKDWTKVLRNLDYIASFFMPWRLCIMTNDGTQGDKLLELLRPHAQRKIRFWTNGVDPVGVPERTIADYRHKWKSPNRFLTVSRLVGWKRVDRVLRVIASLKWDVGLIDYHLIIAGEGDKRKDLESLAWRLGISESVDFVGGVSREAVSALMSTATLLFSMYDWSNVGNPLLEALRTGLPVVTLSNGDTERWIQHFHNGLIYQPSTGPIVIAKDVSRVVTSKAAYDAICSGVRETARSRLRTWEQRLDEEVREVEVLASTGS